MPISNPPEWVLHDAPTRCPYLPGQTARLPLRLPTRPLTPFEFAARLAAGDRRQGMFLYRPACPACHACEALRVSVDDFHASRSQRRILRRGDRLLTTRIAPPTVTAEKVALYNRHKLERRLMIGNDLLDSAGYEQFLVDTCTETIELTYRCGERLVALAISDRAADGLSAVYCFFDPGAAELSPGSYSILKQIELCRRWGLRYLYLGLYVADCAALNYKARYLPHERLIGGTWQRVDRNGDNGFSV
jgi:arginine-tRNA-protein transferase